MIAISAKFDQKFKLSLFASTKLIPQSWWKPEINEFNFFFSKVCPSLKKIRRAEDWDFGSRWAKKKKKKKSCETYDRKSLRSKKMREELEIIVYKLNVSEAVNIFETFCLCLTNGEAIFFSGRLFVGTEIFSDNTCVTFFFPV